MNEVLKRHVFLMQIYFCFTLLITSTARAFVASEVIPVAAELDRTGEYPHDIFKKAWECGFVNPHSEYVFFAHRFHIYSVYNFRNTSFK